MQVKITGKIERMFDAKTTKTGKQMQTITVATVGKITNYIKVIALDLDIGNRKVGDVIDVIGGVSADAYIDKEGKARGQLVIFADEISGGTNIPVVEKTATKVNEDIPF